MKVTASLRTVAKGGNVMAKVFFRVRDVGVDLQATSELAINPKYWDSVRMGYKDRVSLVSDAKRLEFNEAIQTLITKISREYYRGATNEWLRKLIFAFHHPNAFKLKGKQCIDLKLTSWIDRYASVRLTDYRQQYCYMSLIGLVQRFEAYQRFVHRKAKYVLGIDTMTADDLRALEKYIINEYEYKKLYPQLYSDSQGRVAKGKRGGNYLSDTMCRLSTAFNWAVKQGATDNRPFERYDMPRKIYGTPFYLSLEERNLIYDMDLSDSPKLSMYRDVFMLQCLIGCRHGDLSRITKDNIVNGAIEYIPHKTMEKNARTVRVPLNEKATVVLRHLLDMQKDKETIVPKHSLSEYNLAIKKLLTRAGITRMVTVVDPITQEEVKRPINEIASSHMARRIFCGNLYKQVKDANLVSSMSGHSEGSRAFARYRAIDDDMKKELVELLN